MNQKVYMVTQVLVCDEQLGIQIGDIVVKTENQVGWSSIKQCYYNEKQKTWFANCQLFCIGEL